MNKKSNSFFDIIKGLIVLIILVAIVVFTIQYLINILSNTIAKFAQATSKVDAVIIVALITGAVSILGVVLSSIAVSYTHLTLPTIA